MDLKSVIKKPVVTELSTRLLEANQYTFEVATWATKYQIAQAVEMFLGKVKVTGVRTTSITPRVKRSGRQRRPGRSRLVKKAIVQLAKGDKIDFLPEAPVAKKPKKAKKETSK